MIISISTHIDIKLLIDNSSRDVMLALVLTKTNIFWIAPDGSSRFSFQHDVDREIHINFFNSVFKICSFFDYLHIHQFVLPFKCLHFSDEFHREVLPMKAASWLFLTAESDLNAEELPCNKQTVISLYQHHHMKDY